MLGRPCIAFEMKDAKKAYKHFDLEIIESMGETYEGINLHVWTDRERILHRCKRCGGYILTQIDEIHDIEFGDYYYCDHFPVSGSEEAKKINQNYNGFQIEESFPGKWMICDPDQVPYWRERNVDE